MFFKAFAGVVYFVWLLQVEKRNWGAAAQAGCCIFGFCQMLPSNLKKNLVAETCLLWKTTHTYTMHVKSADHAASLSE